MVCVGVRCPRRRNARGRRPVIRMPRGALPSSALRGCGARREWREGGHVHELFAALETVSRVEHATLPPPDAGSSFAAAVLFSTERETLIEERRKENRMLSIYILLAPPPYRGRNLAHFPRAKFPTLPPCWGEHPSSNGDTQHDRHHHRRVRRLSFRATRRRRRRAWIGPLRGRPDPLQADRVVVVVVVVAFPPIRGGAGINSVLPRVVVLKTNEDEDEACVGCG